MSKKQYIPRPLDTSEIYLSESLTTLAEDLARNVHEVWAASRIVDGWQWGEERNDKLKTHPCLVPYEELSEEEKDYDRRTSQETLKFIMEQGYEIIKIK